MCLTRAYLSGIRKIVFAISKKSLDQWYYEGGYDNSKMIEAMNEPIEYSHVVDLESEALKIVEEWEKVQKV